MCGVSAPHERPIVPHDDMTMIYVVVAISMIVMVVLVDLAFPPPLVVGGLVTSEGERATRNQACCAT